MQEKMCPVLMTSVHDTVRNEAAKKRREDLRLQAELEEKRKNESEMDYLAPFLAQMGDPAELTRVQAKQLKEDALHDLKTRLIQQANMIQERFDRETGEIHLLLFVTITQDNFVNDKMSITRDKTQCLKQTKKPIEMRAQMVSPCYISYCMKTWSDLINSCTRHRTIKNSFSSVRVKPVLK